MRKNSPKITKLKSTRKEKKPILKRIVNKIAKRRRKKEYPLEEMAPKLDAFLQKEKETVEVEKIKLTAIKEVAPANIQYNLPFKYGDNRITLLPRDPWWIFTYWDISEGKINEVISSIPVYERENLRWILRVYDVTSVKSFDGSNANFSFDIDISFEANNWYINVNNPERDWCVEIGLINPFGKFFPIARSNTIKTPCFGISSIIDEEWALPDEEYYKVLGVYDLGKSSLERKKRFEEIIKHQISSPLASWGVSSLFSERVPLKEKFFLEVWTELILYGRTEPDAEVTVEGKKVALRPDGTFSLRYSLPVGDFKYEVAGVSKNKKHKITKTPAVKRYDK
jgi:hypothetical protein